MENHEQIGSFPASAILGILSVITAFSLFFGFLVVNIYLGQFGFWDFNFLRVEYVTAGILFMLFITFPSILWWLLDKMYDSLNAHTAIHKSVFKKILSPVLKLIFLSIALYINYVFFSLLVSASSFSKTTSFGIASIGWFVIIAIVAAGMRKSYRGAKALKKIDPMNLREMIEGWAELSRPAYYLPLFLFVMPLAFSIFLYPLVPRYWGGGAQTKIMIYLKSNTNLTSPLPAKLIYQSQDSLLINASGSTYLLPTDQILDIQYLGSNQNFQKLLDGMTGD